MREPVLHIIIAEDEDLVALAVAAVLEDQGFRVTTTHNGLEALEADKGDPADLLLTDMRMPVMDGSSLIRLIRERRPELPVVVVTGYSDAIPREELGRLVVLLKPYAFDRLLETVQFMLRKT